MTPLSLALSLLAPFLPQDRSALEMRPVELRRPDGGAYAAERGTLTAPLVRGDAASPTIEVDVWRFPAEEGAPEGAPPIVLLHGGPGWPGWEASDVDLEGEVLPKTRFADLVVVGQRGIGTSSNTSCDAALAGLEAPEGVEDSREALRAELLRRSAACREYWETRGLAISGFNVLEAAADVDDVRRLLGYEEIALMGTSFGSHWSMAVLRTYPDRVARALLSGLEGPDHTYDRPSGVLGALERLAAAAERDPRLAERIPEGGLVEALRAVIRSVQEDPFEMVLPDPSSGEERSVWIDGDALRGVATGVTRTISSRAGMPTWPADVIRLHEGDFEPVARVLLSRRGRDLGLPTAAFFGLDCGSGITRERLAELQRDPAVEVVGDLTWWYESTCPAWGVDLGDEFRGPFRSSVPTVIVHGTWDVNTPYDNALELRPYFEDLRFIPVHGGSHGALGEAARMVDGFADAVLGFLATGETDGLPEEIHLPDPNWSLPR